MMMLLDSVIECVRRSEGNTPRNDFTFVMVPRPSEIGSDSSRIIYRTEMSNYRVRQYLAEFKLNHDIVTIHM